jgi:tripartite-type tricarboxylate transporter receptor subunit TctC
MRAQTISTTPQAVPAPTHHLAGELFNIMARTHLKHVPYRGSGPAMQDLLAGHVPIMFDGLGTSGPQITAGAIRGLAVTTTKRVPVLPDVPTSAEAGLPGFEFSTWYGVFAPKGTPVLVVERMAKEIGKALQSPAIHETWAKNGSDIPDVSGAEFKELVSFDIARWHKVVQEAGIRLD